MKKGFYANIEQETLENQNFRKVLYTAKGLQLVLMALQPNEDIWAEIHHENDQFFRFESGIGEVQVNDTVYEVEDGDVIIVPAGAKHNVTNTSDSELFQVYTIYSPAHHKDGVIHETKVIAEEAEENGTDEFEGETTE